MQRILIPIFLVTVLFSACRQNMDEVVTDVIPPDVEVLNDTISTKVSYLRFGSETLANTSNLNNEFATIEHHPCSGLYHLDVTYILTDNRIFGLALDSSSPIQQGSVLQGYGTFDDVAWEHFPYNVTLTISFLSATHLAGTFTTSAGTNGSISVPLQ